MKPWAEALKFDYENKIKIFENEHLRKQVKIEEIPEASKANPGQISLSPFQC